MGGLWRNVHWGYRTLFLGIALLLLFIRLLPLGEVPGRLPGPDLLLCMILAWVMRRPDYLPVWLIAGVVFVEDLILMRPPGLWTVIVVIVTEVIRSRVALTRELNFLIEWILVTGLMMAMLLVYRLIFTVSLLTQPPFGFALVQVIGTVLAYPIVVGLSHLALDLRKPATGEMDSFGRRL